MLAMCLKACLLEGRLRVDELMGICVIKAGKITSETEFVDGQLTLKQGLNSGVCLYPDFFQQIQHSTVERVFSSL